MLKGETGAVTETAGGSNIIVHSTPIATQPQVNETEIDSGIQLTPVSTNKSKQSEETDIMSFLRKMDNKFEKMDNKFDMLNKRFDDNDKRFDNNEIILNKMKSDRCV